MEGSFQKYDFIILGGGASGLSLAHRMHENSFFSDKKIAVIEKSKKDSNDRTWCFWSKEKSLYDPIVSKSWNKLHFYSKTLDKSLDLGAYHYNMIKGLDFYNHVYRILENSNSVSLINDEVLEIKESADSVTIKCKNTSYRSPQVFKSYPALDKIDLSNDVYVDQHFKGFFIHTEEDSFDPEEATFMDFRVDQKGEVRFLYVLPETPRKALVEVALFSNEHLQQDEYDQILIDYIKEYLKIKDYEILEEEYGVIPMTSYPFFKHNTSRLFHIGTGGGVVKASSGYAFSRIQRHSEQLIDCIVNKKPLAHSYKKLHGRHLFYDKIMLHAMMNNGAEGEDVFTKLFRHKKAYQVFKFLDQETSHFEDVGIFTAPPTIPFAKSFFQVLK